MNINKIIAEELQHFNEELYNDEYDNNNISNSLADKFYNDNLGVNTTNQRQLPIYSSSQKENKSTGNGKYIGSFPLGVYENARNVSIYFNPLNLNEFPAYTRGVIFNNGDLYLANQTEVDHREILDFLSKKFIIPANSKNIYYKKENLEDINYLAIQRVVNTNRFDVSSVYSVYENLTDKQIEILNTANKKQPYEFYSSQFNYVVGQKMVNNKYKNNNTVINKFIQEELQNFDEAYKRFYSDYGEEWYDDNEDDSESLADKIYMKSFGISNKEKQPELNTLTKGVFIGNVDEKDYNGLYLNPKSLEGFDYGCRAILFNNGDLYVCKNSFVYHMQIFDLLEEKNIVSPDARGNYKNQIDKYIAIERIKNTNTFALSEIYQERLYSVIVKYLNYFAKKQLNFNFKLNKEIA